MSEKKFCKNPIITSIYTADPAPMVYGDTLYLYTTHDEDELVNNFYNMFNWEKNMTMFEFKKCPLKFQRVTCLLIYPC